MATRDRTEEYMQLRSYKRGKAGDRESLVPEPVVQPLWVTKMDELREIHRKVTQMMTELEDLQQKRLRDHTFKGNDDERDEVAIDTLTGRINTQFKILERGVDELDVVYRSELSEDGGSDAELRVLRNVKMSLANDAVRLTRSFSDNQRRYLREVEKQRGLVERGGSDHTKMVVREMERDARAYELREQGMTQQQIEMIMTNQQQVEERVREFDRIAKSIQSIHTMLQDLNTMIVEQGTVLDRIDYNMNVTLERVTKGRQQLEKAAKLQKAGCFKLLLMFLIILIIGLTLAIFVKLII